ncbi:MAG: NAD(P)H-hydrate dehydratase [Spirochaetales bacterium]|nr:NAD(P)H-hydrate dehydratase [Spirochaetales bacterium]
MKVLSPDEMRLMDENCIRHTGIPALVLMENAASAAMTHILSSYTPRHVLIVCGSGNNGGDGLALARKLHSWGVDVSILVSGSRDRMAEAPRTNLEILDNLNLPLYFDPAAEERQTLFHRSDLIVDALFGTGLNREITGEKRLIIEEMNRSGSPVVSLDIPSGINGETSKIMGTAVQADSTVCFGAPKKGNVLAPGYLNNGKLCCSRISFPPSLYDHEQYKTALNLPGDLKDRDPLGYKNSFGKVLIIGGAENYTGAPALAARGAYRGGAGYVTAAVPVSISTLFSLHSPEAVIRPLAETAHNTIADRNFEDLLALASKQDAVVLGPGLSRDTETMTLVRRLIPSIEAALVIDADALYALAGHPELTADRRKPTVLTPHAGEQKNLHQNMSQSIEESYNALCVYKGPRSVIALPDGRKFINMTGNEALGTAGTGDVLAGMTGAFLAGEDPEEAVQKAVLLHGLSADLYRGGRESFTASDIIDLLPRCFEEYRNRYREWTDSAYGRIQMIPG